MNTTENKTEEHASKNVANNMSKSEMISDSATPASNISGEISKLETTTINLKNIEIRMRESGNVFDGFPNSINVVSNNSSKKHKAYNIYKHQFKKFDLPRPQHNSGALREIKPILREVNTVNSLYQATTSGLMFKPRLQEKYNRRQYFFESWIKYFIVGIRQAVICRISG